MSFKEEHPNYKKYNSPKEYYYSNVPHSAWAGLESLIEEAGGAEREFLPMVVAKIATLVRMGHVEPAYAYNYVPDVVSQVRQRVEKKNQFYVFMDCLAVLCDEGELSIDSLNEYLEENEFGYQAINDTWNNRIRWIKLENYESDTESDVSADNIELFDKGTLQNDDMSQYSFSNTEKKHMQNIKKEIFISHRSLDGAVADMIKDFLVATGIPNSSVFCSSLPGNDINEKIGDEVRTHLKNASIIILILSQEYYKSVYCTNEAGVAWFLNDSLVIPIGLPEIKPEDMIGFLNHEYKLRRIDNDGDVSYLYDQAQDRLNTIPEKHAVVNQETKKLIEKYEKYIESRTIYL